MMSRKTSRSRSNVSGVDGGHRATLSQRVKSHDRVTDLEGGTWPSHFVEAVDAADENVGSEAPYVSAEGPLRSVGCHQQREDIKSFGAGEWFEPCVTAGRISDEVKDTWIRPRHLVDHRFAVGAKGGMESDQTMEAT